MKERFMRDCCVFSTKYKFPTVGGHCYKANIEREMYRDLRIDHILSRLAPTDFRSLLCRSIFFEKAFDLTNQHSPMS